MLEGSGYGGIACKREVSSSTDRFRASAPRALASSAVIWICRHRSSLEKCGVGGGGCGYGNVSGCGSGAGSTGRHGLGVCTASFAAGLAVVLVRTLVDGGGCIDMTLPTVTTGAGIGCVSSGLGGGSVGFGLPGDDWPVGGCCGASKGEGPVLTLCCGGGLLRVIWRLGAICGSSVVAGAV